MTETTQQSWTTNMYPTTGNDASATSGLSIAQRLDPSLVKTLFATALCVGGFIVTIIGFTTEFITPAMFIGPLMLAVCFVICLVRCVQWQSGTQISGGTTQYVGRTVTTTRTVPGQVVTARPTPAATASTSRGPIMAPAHAQAWSYSSYSRFSLGNHPTGQVPYPPVGARPSPMSPTTPTNPVLPPYTPAIWTGEEPPPSYDEATKSKPVK